MRTANNLSPIAIFLICIAANAQPLTVEWMHSYGGAGNDFCRSAQQTTDGGFIMVGESDSFCGGDTSWIWLVKTNADGNTEWTRIFGDFSPYGDVFAALGSCVRQTADNGYIIAGYLLPYQIGNGDWLLIKTDGAGISQWQESYGGTGNDHALAVDPTGDGGYLVAGYISAPPEDAGALKINATGDSLWSGVYGGIWNDRFYSVQQTADSGYILAGTTPIRVSNIQGWLVKLSSGGTLQWSQTCGEDSEAVFTCVRQTADGGYIAGGWTSLTATGDYDLYMVKTDANGDPIWQQTFGGPGNDWGQGVCEAEAGIYLIMGYSWTSDSLHYDLMVVKTNADGDSIGGLLLGGSGWDYGEYIQQTNDGDYMVAGYTSTGEYGANELDFWLIKLGEPGTPAIEVSPNPLNFGYIQTGTQDTLLLTISNTGSAVLELYSITITDLAFRASLTTQDSLLGPGESRYLSVIFSPTNSTPYGAILTIFNNDTLTQVLLVGGGLGVVEAAGAEMPETFALHEPYPNPFNPTTTIRFDVPVAGEVRLEVFDLAGRAVVGARRAVPLQAGVYELPFDGTDLPSGIYLCRMTAGEFVGMRKMILLK